MSHRQSCDRCRQQKVRCLREEEQRRGSYPSSLGRTFSRCERCTKAGVDCVYSLKQKSHRRSTQGSNRRDIDLGLTGQNDTLWHDQSLTGTFSPAGPALEADFADVVCQLSGIDGNTSMGVDFNGWDTNFTSISPSSLTTLATPSLTGAGAGPCPVSITPSITDSHEDIVDIDINMEDDDDDDNGSGDVIANDALSSQLASLSQRAVRAMRRLVRPDRAPLTVSSSEVTEALEHTNTLIRIMNDITASNRDDSTLDSTTTSSGLAFSALACHQHLVALFRTICDTIQQRLQSKQEEQRQQPKQQSARYSPIKDVGPSCMAQFVMVLQLLLHLINRLDRSLCQNRNNSSTWYQNGGLLTPLTPTQPHSQSGGSPTNKEAVELVTASSTGCSSPHDGLLVLVQSMVGTIPNEHEKLRQVIQKLQMETESSELHQQKV